MKIDRQLIIQLTKEVIEESNTSKAKCLVEAMSQKTDVISYLKDNPDASNQEVADALGIRKNNVAGLRSILRKEGILPAKGDTLEPKLKPIKDKPIKKSPTKQKTKSKTHTKLDINPNHKKIIDSYIQGWEVNPNFNLKDFRIDSIQVSGIEFDGNRWDASALTIIPLNPIDDFESIGIIVFNNGLRFIVEHDSFAGDFDTPMDLIDFYSSFNNGQSVVNTIKENKAKTEAFELGRRSSKRLLKDVQGVYNENHKKTIKKIIDTETLPDNIDDSLIDSINELFKNIEIISVKKEDILKALFKENKLLTKEQFKESLLNFESSVLNKQPGDDIRIKFED